MALIVEDGTGLPDAESYLSVTDANTYWTNRGDPTTWITATTTRREIALRRATQYLDAVYGLRWKGTKKVATQALGWPRTGAYDRDEILLDEDSLPQKLEEATAEAAYRDISETAGLLPDLARGGDVLEESKRLGELEKSVVYAGGSSPLKKFTLIDRLLADLMQRFGQHERS